GGFLAAFLLLALTPLFTRFWDLPLILVYLQLPVYMLHQLEEHDDDRFRRFINHLIGGGRDVLSKGAVFVINVPGVWGVNLLSILLAFSVYLGFGLIGVYLTLVNGLVHVAQAIRLRSYNPGLVSALVLFIPVGGFALAYVIRTESVTVGYHLLGLGSAILIHVAIIAWVGLNLFRLRSPNS
ncbi:MAG: HXXEE domain-containing protein, partial [Verrucomicrobiota bacterium]